MKTFPGRFPELDAARGVAVFMMVFFHLFVDLSFLGVPGPNPFTGPLRIFGLATASLFILIAGISAYIKAERTSHTKGWFLSFFKRGAELIIIGFGISMVTYWYLEGQGYVVFGILHLIGLAILLTPALYYLGRYNVLLAIAILSIYFLLPLPYGPFWMVWTGIHPVGFISVDYTPVIPWLAVFLIGLLSAPLLYPGGNHRWIFQALNLKLFYPLIYTGRHSLAIYLLHQPIMILILLYIFNRF